MTREEAKSILVQSFGRLTSTQKSNLRVHSKKKTPICCGEQARRTLDFVNGKPGACPAQLALSSEPPPVIFDNEHDWQTAAGLTHRLMYPEIGKPFPYMEALICADEALVREAIDQVGR